MQAKVKSNQQYESEFGRKAKPKTLDRLTEMMRRQGRRINAEWKRGMLPTFFSTSEQKDGPVDDSSESEGASREDELLSSPLVRVTYYVDLAG